MGEEPATVFNTGCPSVDLAARVLANRQNGFDPFAHYSGVGHAFDPHEGYLIVMQHPVTTEYEEAMDQIQETLAAVESLAYPTFWFWPNVDAGSDGISKGSELRKTRDVRSTYFLKNYVSGGFFKTTSRLTVSNWKFERRNSRDVFYWGSCRQYREPPNWTGDRGPNVKGVAYDRKAIITAVKEHLANGRYSSTNLYGDGRAGARIAEILANSTLTTNKRLVTDGSLPKVLAVIPARGGSKGVPRKNILPVCGDL